MKNICQLFEKRMQHYLRQANLFIIRITINKNVKVRLLRRNVFERSLSNITSKKGKKNKKRGNVNKGRQTCKRSGKCKARKRRKDKKLFAFYTDNKICINLRAKDLSRKNERRLIRVCSI